jgi:hypothetical protein
MKDQGRSLRALPAVLIIFLVVSILFCVLAMPLAIIFRVVGPLN